MQSFHSWIFHQRVYVDVKEWPSIYVQVILKWKFLITWILLRDFSMIPPWLSCLFWWWKFWHSIKFPECCHWAFVLFAIQFGIQSDMEERCDYDFFHDRNHMNHKKDYLWQVEYIPIDPFRCKKSDEALMFEPKVCKFRSLKWFSCFLTRSNFGLF